MNSRSKIFLSLFFSLINCFSFCSDDASKLYESQTASQSNSSGLPQTMMTGGLLTTLFGTTGYYACNLFEGSFCGPHSNDVTFSPCEENVTYKEAYTGMIFAGLASFATGVVLGGFEQFSILDAKNKNA